VWCGNRTVPWTVQYFHSADFSSPPPLHDCIIKRKHHFIIYILEKKERLRKTIAKRKTKKKTCFASIPHQTSQKLVHHKTSSNRNVLSFCFIVWMCVWLKEGRRERERVGESLSFPSFLCGVESVDYHRSFLYFSSLLGCVSFVSIW
jgi:hypothetical protein